MAFLPPVYPTRVRTTPGRLPNWASGPQNQPRAKVAVSVSAGTAASIGGISIVELVFIAVKSIVMTSLLSPIEPFSDYDTKILNFCEQTGIPSPGSGHQTSIYRAATGLSHFLGDWHFRLILALNCCPSALILARK